MNHLRIHGEPVAPDRPPSDSVDTAVQPVPLHPVTRSAAFVFGLLSMGAAVIVIVYPIMTLFSSGWIEFLKLLPIAVVFAPGCVMLGCHFWRGAISGVEPDSEDLAMAAAESRAFLAAVEKHEAADETPGGHGPSGAI